MSSEGPGLHSWAFTFCTVLRLREAGDQAQECGDGGGDAGGGDGIRGRGAVFTGLTRIVATVDTRRSQKEDAVFFERRTSRLP
jgi:hypothetical protein